jgi:3-oxocholest-4-en-26-oate---CoA ligase
MRFGDDAKRRLHDLGVTSIVDLLASTEAGPFAVTTTTSAADLPGRPRLLPGAVVLDERDRDVSARPGATGVLGLRGTLPAGYHGDEAKTRETFRLIDGARHVVVGDWARVLDGGFIELLGRGSSVVNTGGEKVYPAEVEEALLSHPAIADAVVVGVPDPRFGEIVAAVAVPRGAPPSDDALRAHLDERLAGYKKPRRIRFRADLERSPHGKLDLARVRDWLTEDQDDGGLSPRG